MGGGGTEIGSGSGAAGCVGITCGTGTVGVVGAPGIGGVNGGGCSFGPAVFTGLFGFLVTGSAFEGGIAVAVAAENKLAVAHKRTPPRRSRAARLKIVT